MKRFWLVLLSLGLIVAFSTQAMAVDVKSSGEFYAAGMYVDKGDVLKGTSWTNTSSAFYFQRLRLTTTFIVHPGLFLITRADIMERSWGAARSAGSQLVYDEYGYASGVVSAPLDTLSAGTRAENENIAFDLCYVMYISPVGIFLAGYQIDGAWGTVFGDNSLPTGKIGYMFRKGPITLGIQTGKNNENSLMATNFNQTAVDRDSSFYTAYGIYSWKGGQVGFLAKYIRNAINRNVVGDLDVGPFPIYRGVGLKVDAVALLPYVKAQLGPVALQAEIIYVWGKQKWEGLDVWGIGYPKPDKDMGQLSGWIDATADFGRFYVGGTFAYLAGDDLATDDKAEGGNTGGIDWNPCLILWNNDMTYWQGGQFGANGTATSGPMSNAYFLQARAGVRPVEKLDIMVAVSWAHADKTLSAQWESREYGYEVDLVGVYKITNNLSYMLGGGYLFTGDWFKGINAGGTNEVVNNFLVLNKLILTL